LTMEPYTQHLIDQSTNCKELRKLCK
jgi:hypothetical protein